MLQGSLRRAKFHANPGIFGQKQKQKIAKIANFFAPPPSRGANPFPDVDEIRRFMWVIGLQKLLTFGAIRLIN